MRPATETRNWPIGAQKGLPAEQLSPEVLWRAYNTAFRPIPGGTLAIGPRPGLALFAQSTASTASTFNLASYPQTASTPGFILHVANGDVRWLRAAAETKLSVPGSVTISGGGHQPVQIGSTIYWASAGGSTIYDWKVYAGTTVLPYGIITPTSAPTATSAGAGTPNGTYYFKVTWYDSTRGVESSPSDAGSYTTSGAEDITVNRNNATPPDGVDQWKLYVLKDGTLANYYLTTTVATATTTLTFSSSDATITALTTRGPDANANDPPPALTCHAWHLNRMFGGTGSLLSWSNTNKPDNWNPSNAITVGEGSEGDIEHLLSLGISRMAIFKQAATYVLDGDSPANWVVGRVLPHIGARSNYSVARGDGFIAFVGLKSAYIWTDDLGGAPQDVGLQITGDHALDGRGDSERMWYGRVIFDPEGHRFLFWYLMQAFQPSTDYRWTMASWSTVHKCWESGGWDIRASSEPRCACTFLDRVDGTDVERLAFGLDNGTVGILRPTTVTDLAANTSGANLSYDIDSGATSASFTVSNAATFPVRTAGTSRVTVIDGVTGVVEQRTYTSSGTTTKTITLGATLSFTPGDNSVAVFDMPVVEVDSGAFGAEDHTRKRALLGYVGASSDGDVPFRVYAYADGTETAGRAFTATLKGNRPTEWTSTPAAISGATPLFRQRLGLVGQFFRLKVVGWYPTAKWAITRIGMKIARWSR